jgi:exodeoxyribonuclease V alpha subunit
MPGEALELVLTATVDEILFHDRESGFAVVRGLAEGEPRPVVAVGPIGEPHRGETLRISGAFEDHPRFGRRFRATSAIPVTPSTEAGIKKLLGSGRFEGIGKKTADKIVEALGAKTFDLLLAPSGPPRIEGVPKKKLRALATALKSERARVETVTFLAGLGLTVRLAGNALETLGAEAARKVRANPYCLSMLVDGIGFPTADRVAAGLGVSGDHPQRLEAGILHTLGLLADDGHVCVAKEFLFRRAEKLLGADPEALERALADAVAHELAVLETRYEDTTCIYRPDLYRAECEVASLLEDGPRRSPVLDSADDLAVPLPEMLSDEQRDAVLLLLTNPVAILTGGPGVGKTTVIQAVAAAADAAGKTVVLAAPTGRAARRITETSGLQAHTIHKLLGLRPDSGRVSAMPTQPIEADALIVDEASMVDLKLFAHVLRQLPSSAALILVGDKDQLPSVGPGDVLNDLITSGRLPVARLEHIFRQESAGLIVRNAHRALAGLPPVSPKAGELSDFYFLERDDAGEGADLIRDLVATRLPSRMGFDPRSDIQVLAPMYRGQAGADRLNGMLQEALNGSALSVTRGTTTFRVGDRVIFTRNDYERELANGDLGRVVGVDVGSGTVIVRFAEGTHRFDSWMDLKLAFALTVHKSQGSEYPVVVLPVFLEHRAMLRRGVIYTAMTRARRLLVIVGQAAALSRALQESRRDLRGSLLARRLSGAHSRQRRIEAEDEFSGVAEDSEA